MTPKEGFDPIPLFLHSLWWGRTSIVNVMR